MNRIRGGLGKRGRRVRVSAPDPSLTGNAGMVAVTELCDRLDVIASLDAAVGPIKVRDRGFGAGELLVGLASAQLAGQDFLVGLDRVRTDAAGQKLSPVPGLASTTAAGLARRFTDEHWRAVESGVAAVTERMLALLPPDRAEALTSGPVTIDVDATDVEVYGRKKRGVAYNHQGQRVGRPHVATWAETETVLAADLGSGVDDPRATAAGLLKRALAGLPQRVCRGNVALRVDAGYFAGQLARAASEENIAFAIGAKRIAPLWRLLSGIGETDWHTAVDMDNAEVAVADYAPRDWPEGTRLLIRRVRLSPSRSQPIPDPGAAVPCTPTSGHCHSMNSPTPRRSTRTRSSRPTSTCPPRIGRSQSSTGTGIAPASKTSSATASTAPRCVTCPADIPRSTPRGCGDHCSRRVSPAGATSSPAPSSART